LAIPATTIGVLAEQRYEPLPSLDQLPVWLWRRTAPWARVAIGVALVMTIASTAVLVPALQREKRARAVAEQHSHDVRHRLAIAALKHEQEPRLGRSAEAARPAMLRDLEGAILSDARTRGLPGPILSAGCEPFPKTVGEPAPERDPHATSGSYTCLAVTSEIDRSAATSGGEIGHPYRANLDFATGRFAFCKIAGRPDPIPDPEVNTPRVCTGGRVPAS
jgi:hypothetical protein